MIPRVLLLGTCAWSFVHVSLPLHIQGLSRLPPAATLRWILGIPPLMTVLMASLWGGWPTGAGPGTSGRAEAVGGLSVADRSRRVLHMSER